MILPLRRFADERYECITDRVGAGIGPGLPPDHVGTFVGGDFPVHDRPTCSYRDRLARGMSSAGACIVDLRERFRTAPRIGPGARWLAAIMLGTGLKERHHERVH
jgi:hypothetical protein